MKRIYTYILTSMVATLLPVACSKESIEPASISDRPTFSASIEGAHTRATDNYWENGDKIGVSGGEDINVCYVCHVTPDGDILELEDPQQQLYFKDANEVLFTAYYPYSSNRDASTGLISISTADQTNRRDFDFLWAQAEGSKSSPNVKFTFRHKMSKVTFVFKNGKNMDVSTINKIRLSNLVVEGTFDTTAGVCSVDAATPTASTTMLLSDVQTEEPVTPLYLFPQKVVGPIKLEIYDSGSQYFVCNLSIPDNELKAGFNYTYTITVNKTGLKVTGATLSDWITEVDDSEASSADD